MENRKIQKIKKQRKRQEHEKLADEEALLSADTGRFWKQTK